jgi:hypothetical protein
MTQPKFSPIAAEDEVRSAYRLETPRPWVPHRPGEVAKALPGRPGGRGTPGPDQGYALGLASRLRERLVMAEGEHAGSVLAGGVALALVRAASFGRAPVLGDIEVALALFCFFSPAPAELVERRRQLFDGVSHDYRRQRQLVDAVPLSSLRLTKEVVSLTPWQQLLEPEVSAAS